MDATDDQVTVWGVVERQEGPRLVSVSAVRRANTYKLSGRDEAFRYRTIVQAADVSMSAVEAATRHEAKARAVIESHRRALDAAVVRHQLAVNLLDDVKADTP